MAEKKAKISVLTPTYNDSDSIEETLMSLIRFLTRFALIMKTLKRGLRRKAMRMHMCVGPMTTEY